MYYRLPAEKPTTNLQNLIPNVINPKALSDEELLTHNVARCIIEQPNLNWWQTRGEMSIDSSAIPHKITWEVIDLPLDAVKEIAWQNTKSERDFRQRGLMPYTFPNGTTHHNEMTEKVIRDLSASTTAALALASQGVVDPIMPWTVHENVTHILTPAEMIALGLAATQWHSAIHMQSQMLRAAIDDAETVADVVAASQWPEV